MQPLWNPNQAGSKLGFEMWGHYPMGATITGVQQGSIAGEVGLSAGDIILSVNGHPLTDLLVYRFYEADAELTLLARKTSGEELIIDIEKEPDDLLGISVRWDPALPESLPVLFRRSNACGYAIHPLRKR